MKIEQRDFKPVVLILESQEEIDKVFSLVNYTPICKALKLGELYELLFTFKTDGYQTYHKILDTCVKGERGLK